jgi:hypothetical protein
MFDFVDQDEVNRINFGELLRKRIDQSQRLFRRARTTSEDTLILQMTTDLNKGVSEFSLALIIKELAELTKNYAYMEAMIKCQTAKSVLSLAVFAEGSKLAVMHFAANYIAMSTPIPTAEEMPLAESLGHLALECIRLPSSEFRYVSLASLYTIVLKFGLQVATHIVSENDTSVLDNVIKGPFTLVAVKAYSALICSMAKAYRHTSHSVLFYKYLLPLIDSYIREVILCGLIGIYYCDIGNCLDGNTYNKITKLLWSEDTEISNVAQNILESYRAKRWEMGY